MVAEDIPLLLAAFAARMNRRGLTPPLFSATAVEALKRWPWPGNVRELAHLVERLSILHPGAVVDASGLPAEMRNRAADAARAAGKGTSHPPAMVNPEMKRTGLEHLLDMDFKSAKALFETWYLEKKLEEAGGNITRLAELVGLERSYVHRKLKAGRSGEHKTR